MKRMNEDGITLVELLAALVLVTIVTAVIWNTVFISMKYTTVETKKLRLQQEANYIIAEIQRYHRQCDSYILTIKSEAVELGDCTPSSSDPTKKLLPDLIISNGFQYATSEESTKKLLEDLENEKDPIETKKDEASLSFKLIVQDSERVKLKVEIPTNISRYK